MRVINCAIPMLLLAVLSQAQVLAPDEIRDPNLRELQKKYLGELHQIPVMAAKHDFPYRFYFSRKLDLSEKEQQTSDQRSIQFDRYHDQTVLKITGNYFASYSTELMQPTQRARQTYQDVILPLLEAAAPLFVTSTVPHAFAFEISHHVRKKILGVSSEGIENVVLILPKAAALRYMTASDERTKQAALSTGAVFLNASSIELWPGSKGSVGQTVPEAIARSSSAASAANISDSKIGLAKLASAANQPAVVAQSARDSSPEALKSIQNSYQSSLDRMAQEINAQAHFVRYAPPAFIPFHNWLYLQLSVTTTLPESAAGSQYKLAALAFDRHIAHLIRPTLEYFKEDRRDFDGIDFSTSIRLGGDPNSGGGSPVAVEFIFPMNMLRTYKQFDATGQQLIDSGFVLVNGERVSLDLQSAEAGVR